MSFSLWFFPLIFSLDLFLRFLTNITHNLVSSSSLVLIKRRYGEYTRLCMVELILVLALKLRCWREWWLGRRLNKKESWQIKSTIHEAGVFAAFIVFMLAQRFRLDMRSLILKAASFNLAISLTGWYAYFRRCSHHWLPTYCGQHLNPWHFNGRINRG